MEKATAAKTWTTRELALAGLFAALTAVSAQIAIPTPFVPFTMQVLMVLLTGAVLGSRTAALSQVIYLVMGAVGLPVFAHGEAGVQVFAGPTAGYLVGFVLGAWVVGKLLEGRRSPGAVRVTLAMAWGLLAIHIPGALVLSIPFGSVAKAFKYDFATFFPFDVLKAVIAYGVARGLEARGIGRPAVSG